MPWRFWGASPQFNDYSGDVAKLTAIFSNPALLKVICLQCDLFSLAKPYVYNKKGVAQEEHPALDRLDSPNPMQTYSQWMWDYMFWKMIGNAYLYMDSNDINRDNAPMYWLESHKIDWPLELQKKKDHLVFSKSRVADIMNTILTYTYEDGTTFKFPVSKVASIYDLTNGTGNFFKGFSRIDALYKVISNSECALDSKNINIRFAGKFLVAGQADPKDVTRFSMGADEKKDIEDKINGDSWDEKANHKEKQVHAVKSMVDIKRFVDDIRVMPLDEAFLSDYYIIGSMYGIPRDVLEAYKSSTFENQEKARGAHVAYTLDPAADQLGDILTKRWELTKGWKICFSWDHLPFVQVFEKDRLSLKQTQINIMRNMLSMGIPLDEINKFLDTDFTMAELQQPSANGQKKKEVTYEQAN